MHSYAGQLFLKFLKTLKCPTFQNSMKGLGEVIKHCNHLERVKILNSDNSLPYLLEQVSNPRICSLSIMFCYLSSIAAVRKLASLLSRFETVTHLGLNFAKCSAKVATHLIGAINHKTLEKLELSELRLKPAGAGNSLSELSTLRILKISCLPDCSYEALTRLLGTIKHKTLEEMELSEIPLTSAVAGALGQSLPELSALKVLEISCLPDCSDEVLTKLLAAIKHKTLEKLELSDINLTSAVVEALCQSLPELSALKTLRIIGWCAGCLQSKITIWFVSWYLLKISGWNEYSDKAVTRLIDVIKHQTPHKLELSNINLKLSVAESLSQLLPELSALPTLEIHGLTERSSGAGSRFFAAVKLKTLKELNLNGINVTAAETEALSQSLPELSALQTLKINGLTECSEEAVTKLFTAIKHKTLKELELSNINWTSVATEVLGQSLPELSALRTLKISGRLYKCRLQYKEVEALFGRFNRPSSIKELWFTGFTARGSLAPLANNLCFFPRLTRLDLNDLDMGEADLFGLLENLKFIPDLESLYLSGNRKS